MQNQTVILSAVRTPVGRLGGGLKDVNDRAMGGFIIAEALKRAGTAPEEVEEVVFAHQYRTGALPPNMCRPIALDAGLPIRVPQFTVAKACGGSLKSVALADQAIRAGDAGLVVAGGVESMSNAAYLLPKARWGYRLGHGELMDQLVLFDPISGNTMGQTAENVAEKYAISRADQDAFAYASQKKAARALESGVFASQIAPVAVPGKKGQTRLFTTDEHPRPDTTIGKLAGLAAAFRPGGSVTAGNSSGMNDGAAAVVTASRQRARELGRPALASILGFSAVGVEPSLMGLGPIEATRAVLAKTGLSLSDIDLVELNEAFAAQALACIRELGLDEERVNVNGGAIALGHPISATGAVILTKLVHELARREKELGLATMCLGGGQGVAMIVRREV